MLEWRNSDLVAPFMFQNETIPPEVHDEWYSRLLDQRGDRGWIITMDNRPVGAAFISGVDMDQRRADFGMYLADDSTRGKGVGRAALYFLCEYAFTTMELHKLCCEALSFNQAAIALYEKVGFEKEGVLRDHIFREGRWIDVHLLAMFEDRWAVQRGLLTPRLKELGLIA